MLETGFVSRCIEVDGFEGEEFQLADDQPHPASDASVCLVGGFDGGVDCNLWYGIMTQLNHTILEAIKDRMFVAGGGNGVECSSNVEMFDPNIGKWISIQSLLHKISALAAAEINGILYVSGGYNGDNYLK
ncbi:hypothetical protein GQ457_01G036720 [Hibiscus cannabinus]